MVVDRKPGFELAAAFSHQHVVWSRIPQSLVPAPSRLVGAIVQSSINNAAGQAVRASRSTAPMLTRASQKLERRTGRNGPQAFFRSLAGCYRWRRRSSVAGHSRPTYQAQTCAAAVIAAVRLARNPERGQPTLKHGHQASGSTSVPATTASLKGSFEGLSSRFRSSRYDGFLQPPNWCGAISCVVIGAVSISFEALGNL